MFIFINSLSLTTFIVLNAFLILGCIYYIIKEKNRRKLYIPILYIVPIGSIIFIANKYVTSNSNLIQYSNLTKFAIYGYIIFFLVFLAILSLIGLKRNNDPNINKPMILVGMSLLIFSVISFAIIKIIA